MARKFNLRRVNVDKIEVSNRLVVLERKLLDHVDMELARWAYNREEYTDLLLYRQLLRKQIVAVKKELSG